MSQLFLKVNHLKIFIWHKGGMKEKDKNKILKWLYDFKNLDIWITFCYLTAFPHVVIYYSRQLIL